MTISRRNLLGCSAGALALAAAFPAEAQSSKAGSSNATVVQIADMSNAQVDVSKDFLVGARTAWQDINAHGGVRGRHINHVVLETDGSESSLQAALAQAQQNPNCIALVGSCGSSAAYGLSQILQRNAAGLAHMAPWLQHSLDEGDEHTFAIFASRQTQISFALRTWATLGVKQLGVVYASPADEQSHQADVKRLGTILRLDLQSFKAPADLAALGQSLPASAPAMLLFIGGTPELARFSQGLSKQSRQRYVLGVADINLSTLAQLGVTHQTAVIATQPVPLVNANLALVRNFRQALGRLYDEPPTAHSLAGYVSARYAHAVMSGVEGALTRSAVLSACQRRDSLDLGGLEYGPQARKLAESFVTQSMLTPEGRVIG